VPKPLPQAVRCPSRGCQNPVSAVSKTDTYDDIDDLRTAAVSFANGPQNQTLPYDYFPDGSRSLMTFSSSVGVNQNQYNYQYGGLGQLTRAGFPWTGGNVTYAYVTNAATGAVRTDWVNSARTPRGLTTYGPLAYDAPGNKTGEPATVPQQGSAPDISHTLAYTTAAGTS